MAKVGDSITAHNANWTFGGDVAKTFDSHVERSVPLYHEGHRLIAQLSDFFLSDGSIAYEIGSSTGQLLATLAERNAKKDVRIVGYDIESDMVARAQEKCKDYESVEVEVGDIIEVDLEPADLIVAYYTIQFIKPKFRQMVFDKIYQSLNWGGAFIMFEKVRGADARFQDIMTALYTDFKIEQGFNEEEIIGKTRSLKGVLEPFSTQGNLDLLQRAGFKDVMSIAKYVSFEGFLAIK